MIAVVQMAHDAALEGTYGFIAQRGQFGEQIIGRALGEAGGAGDVYEGLDLFEHVFGMSHVDLLHVFSISVIIAHSFPACKACIDRRTLICYIDFTMNRRGWP